MGKFGGWFRGLAAVIVVAGVPAAPADEPEVWITMDRGDAERVGRNLARAGRGDALAVEQDGAVVVARILEDDVPFLALAVHEELRRCGGFIAHASREVALRAAARDRSSTPPVPLVAYTIDNGPVVQALMAGVQEGNIRTNITNLSAFFTRYHTTATGQQSAQSILDLWTGFAQGRSDVSIQKYAHPTATTPQPSIVLTIHGASLPSEVVVLGAHQDSINGASPTTGRSPGADDDGSGVATLSEVIRVALASGYRPERTVKFMAYAAEEVGLRGSNDIAQRFKNANVNVVGAFQLDMTNFKGTAASDIVLITDHTTSAQNTFLGQLVDTYVALPRANSQCGYACSDHASWEDRGYVSSFPFEAVFGQHLSQIHTANDTLTAAGGTASHSVKFARLAAAYMAELAKGGLGPAPHAPPVASAGADTGGSLAAPVTLAGSASGAQGRGRLVWEWLAISGPQGVPVTITNANRRVATFTPAAAGTYVFRVVVNDGATNGTDDVTITVAP
jgi:leucyl aminopeptidase